MTEEALRVLDEALELAEASRTGWWEAELHRLRGEALWAKRDEKRAEASFRRSIELARRQDARSWELRAATSWARLCHRRSSDQEARESLAGILTWFTEGFDTADFREAVAVLALPDGWKPVLAPVRLPAK